MVGKSEMKAPIFVIGNPRSGTTLLRLMLTCHRNIVIPPECGFAIWWYEKYKDWNSNSVVLGLDHYLNDLFSSKKIETWKLNRTHLKKDLMERSPATYADLVSEIYEYFGRNQNKNMIRWGDKNNFYLNHIERISQLFRDAVFVHIIRDGRDVFCSYREMARLTTSSKYVPNLPVELKEAASEWSNNIRKIRKSFHAIGWEKVIEIRYEDLVESPEHTLKRICSFLGEEFDPLMLDFHLRNKEKELEPRDFLAWKEETLETVNTSKVGKYKAVMGKEEIDAFVNIGRDVFQAYGYL